jgi:hypothetical protein
MKMLSDVQQAREMIEEEINIAGEERPPSLSCTRASSAIMCLVTFQLKCTTNPTHMLECMREKEATTRT